MSTQPKIEQRQAQPYAAIRTRVPMSRLASVAPLNAEALAYLQRLGVAPDGAPFFRYLVVDMEGELEVEAGWPTAELVAGDGRVESGTLPAGRYVVVTHRGHPDQLREATAALLEWGAEQGVRWDVSADGTRWGARIEFSLTDPAEEPDMNNWETELAILLAD